MDTRDLPIRKNNLTNIRIGIGLVLATVLTYLPVLWCGFVNWDDPLYVTTNRNVAAGLTPQSIAYAWTTFDDRNWIPLTWMSLELDTTLFGLNPAGFHATNLVIHSLNVWLLFLVLNRLTGSTGRSAIAAFLYGVHPLHVESVAWVSERKDVLSTFWMLVTILMYERYARRPSIVGYIGTTVLMSLGLLAKSMLVTLPICLLLLDFWPMERIALRRTMQSSEQSRAYPVYPWWKLVLEKVPLLMLSLAIGIITMKAQRNVIAKALPPIYRVGNAIQAYGWYLWKTFLPTGLCAFYPHPTYNIVWLWVGISATVLLAFSLFVAFFGNGRRWLIVGWLWFLVTLLPVIGLLQVGSQAYADRYSYVPHVGLFLLIVWGANDLFAHYKLRTCGVYFAVASFMICVALTRTQIGTWHDGSALWNHCLAVNPKNEMAFVGLGSIDFDQHHLEAAQSKFLAALDANPNISDAIFYLGRIARDREEWDRAAQLFSWGLRVNPYDKSAVNDLASIRPKLAPRPISQIPAKPVRRPAPAAALHISRGLKYVQAANFQSAIKEFEEALLNDPGFAGAHMNAALACNEIGRRNDAIEHMQRAIELDPDKMEYHLDLAQNLELVGRLPEAIKHYEVALELSPSDVETQIRLARLQKK